MVYDEGEESIVVAGSRAASTASYLAFSGVFTTIVYGLAFIAIARLLGPSSYGIYAIAVSIAGAFGAVGNFGVATYFERHITMLALRKNRELSLTVASGLLLIVLLGSAITIIGLVFSGLLSAAIFHSTSYVLVLYVALVSIVFSMLYGVSHGALIGFNDGKGSAAVSIIYTLTQTFVSVGLVLYGYGVLGAVTGLLAGLVLGSIAALARISRHMHVGISINMAEFAKRIKSILSFSLPIAGSNFMAALPSNIAVVLMGVYTLASTVGNYSVAARVASILGVFTGSFIVLLPFFSGIIATGKSKEELSSTFSYVLYFMFLFSMPLFLFFIVFAHAIMYTVFPNYESVYVYIILMALGTLVSLFGMPASSFVLSKAKVTKVLAFSSITGITELVLLFLLIPMFGVYAAIAVLYFVGTALTAYLYLNEAKKEGIALRFGKLYRVLATGAMLLVVFLLVLLLPVDSTAKLAVGFVLLFAVYPPALVFARALQRSDFGTIRSVTHTVPVLGKVISALLAYAEAFVK